MPRARRRTRRSSAALGGIGSSADASALVAALESGVGTVRQDARQSLVAIGKPAVRTLIEALRHPNENVRWGAAKALGEIQDKTSAAALVLALEDESFGVRWLAAEGLIALGRNALRPLLRALVERAGSTWLREGALHVLNDLATQGLGDDAKPVVAALLGPQPKLQVPLAAEDVVAELPRARRRRGSSRAAAH
jgi:HEAT repeat protein